MNVGNKGRTHYGTHTKAAAAASSACIYVAGLISPEEEDDDAALQNTPRTHRPFLARNSARACRFLSESIFVPARLLLVLATWCAAVI